jgi:rhomboid protease GluP
MRREFRPHDVIYEWPFREYNPYSTSMVPQPPKTDGPDWVESIVQLAAGLGFNPVRVRWRLLRMQDRLTKLRERAQRRVQHSRWQHKVCGACGAVNDRSERKCVQCGARLGARWVDALARLGVLPKTPGRATVLLAALILLCFAREMSTCGISALVSPSGYCLIRMGGNMTWQVLVQGLHPGLATQLGAGQAPEYWRLGTAMFLHIGIIHLLFNLAALAQVGPMVEELLGSGRMLVLYLGTGLVGNWLSSRYGNYSVSAGASGAIMGLCGVVAGWGQRDGTSVGRNSRNHMVRWAIYTVLFGVFVRGDNWAHCGGFLAGALPGLLVKPAWLRRSRASGLDLAMGTTGVLSAVALAALVVLAPYTLTKYLPAEAPRAAARLRAEATVNLPQIAPPRNSAGDSERAGR